MSYMLLIHEPVGQRSTRNLDEGRAVYARMQAFGAALQARGLLQAAASLASTTGATRLQLAWGQYVQYPEIAMLTSTLGRRGLLPARSIHTTAALEQRLGERTRLRLEVYDRADRDLPFQSLYEPRVVAGRVVAPPLNPLPPSLDFPAITAKAFEEFKKAGMHIVKTTDPVVL